MCIGWVGGGGVSVTEFFISSCEVALALGCIFISSHLLHGTSLILSFDCVFILFGLFVCYSNYMYQNMYTT